MILESTVQFFFYVDLFLECYLQFLFFQKVIYF